MNFVKCQISQRLALEKRVNCLTEYNIGNFILNSDEKAKLKKDRLKILLQASTFIQNEMKITKIEFCAVSLNINIK